MKNFLALDIGNSTIDIGIFGENLEKIVWLHTYPVQTLEGYSDIFKKIMQENGLKKESTGLIISSVVPEVSNLIIKSLKELIDEEPLIVSYTIKTGLMYMIAEPSNLGADRIANAVAVNEIYKGPAIIVDFGTATSISIIDERNRFMGGSIFPGLRMMSKALAQGAALLKEVELVPPPSSIGTNTTGCIKAGIFFGLAGATERLINEIKREMKNNYKIVITGGFSNLIKDYLKYEYIFHPNLTLEGLKILYRKNRDA